MLATRWSPNQSDGEVVVVVVEYVTSVLVYNLGSSSHFLCSTQHHWANILREAW